MLAKLTPGREISTHAPAGGATGISGHALSGQKFLLTPLREGRQAVPVRLSEREDFYSRPCGRGDAPNVFICVCSNPISTHAPAGGATMQEAKA